MAKAVNIQARIDLIAKELANGLTREAILTKSCKKFQLSERQIDNYIKDATTKAETALKRKNEAVERATIEVITEATRNGLKSVLEVDARLQEIIFNSHKLIKNADGKIAKVENTTADILKAMDIYYKRNGHYAPQKLEHKGGVILNFIYLFSAKSAPEIQPLSYAALGYAGITL